AMYGSPFEERLHTQFIREGGLGATAGCWLLDEDGRNGQRSERQRSEVSYGNGKRQNDEK
ncbi:MAG: hypothetical protein KGZ25_10675, partial [Planctomycetes bacterium]|nr:hypothetical protein [Planctomycetota bacterium]